VERVIYKANDEASQQNCKWCAERFGADQISARCVPVLVLAMVQLASTDVQPDPDVDLVPTLRPVLDHARLW